MNPRITALKLQARNPKRVNVYLDGLFGFALASHLAASLKIDEEIPDDVKKKLVDDDEQEKAWLRALHFIGYRPRSENEVQKKLLDCGYSSEVTEKVMFRLRENNLVGDDGFARAWVENRSAFRPRSHRLLSWELFKKGVAGESIQKALVSTLGDEELAYQAASRQAHRYLSLEWMTFREKLTAFLLRRGFNYSITAPVVKRVWQEQVEAETSTISLINSTGSEGKNG